MTNAERQRSKMALAEQSGFLSAFVIF